MAKALLNKLLVRDDGRARPHRRGRGLPGRRRPRAAYTLPGHDAAHRRDVRPGRALCTCTSPTACTGAATRCAARWGRVLRCRWEPAPIDGVDADGGGLAGGAPIDQRPGQAVPGPRHRPGPQRRRPRRPATVACVHRRRRHAPAPLPRQLYQGRPRASARSTRWRWWVTRGPGGPLRGGRVSPSGGCFTPPILSPSALGDRLEVRQWVGRPGRGAPRSRC